ncbi:MAG: type I restriction endonuclease subunit R, partial [Candidatus Omnitrophica bacterium]|nr:type I restriction endonuclease subunit R [Candidatus Omnitrophota bacterium]
MTFNEQNTVEQYVISKLTGHSFEGVTDSAQPEYGKTAQWKYVSAEEIGRDEGEIIIEAMLKDALIRINPEIRSLPERADEVIYKLRAILLSVHDVGLVRANEEFAKWLQGDKTMPFGENNQHVPVRLIDFETLSNNSFIATNQYKVTRGVTKIPDMALLVNGIPIVVGEFKTPVRPSISWLDGAVQI